MSLNSFLPRAIHLPLILLAALHPAPLHAQFWDSLTKPKVNITLTHAPDIGLIVPRVAVGPVVSPCAGEVADRLTTMLNVSGVQVMDWPSLQVAFARQHIAFSGNISQDSALRLGNAMPPTVLIMVNINSCEQEKQADHTDSKTDDDKDVRTFNSTLITHVRGSLQAEELSTGRVFTTIPLDMDHRPPPPIPAFNAMACDINRLTRPLPSTKGWM